MKTFNKKYLAENILYNGENYKVNPAISAAMSENNTPVNTIAATLKKQDRKAILVNVLNPALKGILDLYGKEYKPTKWIFTND